MSKQEIEMMVSKIDGMNERIANCDSMEELEKLQEQRETYIMESFTKIKNARSA